MNQHVPDGATPEAADALVALQQKYSGQLDVYLCPVSRGTQKEKVLQLHTLRAKKTARAGMGTAFMEDLASWADTYHITLILDLASKGDSAKSEYKRTSSTNRIKQFYQRFGFASSYGKRTYRPDLGCQMHRYPKKMVESGFSIILRSALIGAAM